MTTFRITYLDKYQQEHTTDVPADDVQAAIAFLEEQLNEEIEVSKIEMDPEDAS